MIKINEVPNNIEPRNKMFPKLQKGLLADFRGPEMQPSETAFLCGLLKTYKPKKILEVGIAKGSTTAIVLQTLEDIGEPYEMRSVDIAEQCYSFKTKRTGFVAEFAKENNLFNSPDKPLLYGSHEFYLGKYLPQVIDEIGGGIDFVILDTVHYTPGELMDFLVMLPYIKDDSIVVLHDVSLNQRNLSWHKPDAHATGLLFSAVVAKEKFLNYEVETKERPFHYPNIGAFKIGKGTRTHIGNVFLALTLTWHYLPKDDEVSIYREFYNRHYSAKLVDIFNETVKMNSNNIALKK